MSSTFRHWLSRDAPWSQSPFHHCQIINLTPQSSRRLRFQNSSILYKEKGHRVVKSTDCHGEMIVNGEHSAPTQLNSIEQISRSNRRFPSRVDDWGSRIAQILVKSNTNKAQKGDDMECPLTMRNAPHRPDSTLLNNFPVKQTVKILESLTVWVSANVIRGVNKLYLLIAASIIIVDSFWDCLIL